MATSPQIPQVLRFDVFELDVRVGELRKRGTKLRLQGQPLQVLGALLKRPGDLVTREELRAEIWPADTFVDFDHSLHNAIARIRGWPRCHSILGWSLIFHGDKAEGIASVEHAVALSPGSTLFLSQLGQACAVTGNVQRARDILQQLRDRAEREFVSPYHFAYVHTGLGEADAAIEWLENAFERRHRGRTEAGCDLLWS
jgi:tetratricopeptide (TPR) repeat protein